MNRRILFFAALAIFGGLLFNAPLFAQAPDTPVISTSTSPTYPEVTCTSADDLACADTLQLAADTRDQLAGVLQLGPNWRFAVHIHVLTPNDPLTAKIDREAAAVFSQGSTMKIEAVVPVSDPAAREFIQRQFVTALLWEKFFAKTTSFDKNTHLDVVPLWLVEGLREWLNEDTDHNRESIVRRAVKTQTAPTVADVTGWHELSNDRLLGLWQRAFCYYLVDGIIQKGAPRDQFQQWLAGFSSANPSQAPFNLRTEIAWHLDLEEATDRSRAITYASWAETSTELKTDETITFAASKDAPIQTCTLDTVTTKPRSPALLKAVQERIMVLTELELRAHPSWHPILELYRSGLTALVNDSHIDQAQKLLQEARRRRGIEADDHQKILDYINWFEVTRNYQDDTTRFDPYFTTAREMEKVEADPAHPNPIRANLLEIESEL